jgi:hypothetical protein
VIARREVSKSRGTENSRLIRTVLWAFVSFEGAAKMVLVGRIVDQLDLDTRRLVIIAVFTSSSKSEWDSQEKKLDTGRTSNINLLEHSTCWVENE